MVVVSPLSISNIKSFYDHHLEMKQVGLTIYDFDPEVTSFLNSFRMSINSKNVTSKRIQETNNFYENNNLKTICLSKSDEYIGNVVFGANILNGSLLEKHIKPQLSFKNMGIDKPSYLSIKKINIKENIKPSEYYPAIVEAIEKNGFDEFVMIVSQKNKPLNQIFSTMVKFCGGKILNAKHTVSYIIKAYSEKVKEAFKELEILKVLHENDGIQSIIEGLKKISNIKGDLRLLFGGQEGTESFEVKDSSPIMKRMESFRKHSSR